MLYERLKMLQKRANHSQYGVSSGRASYSMLEDAANNTATVGAGLTTGSIAKAIANRTEGGKLINNFVSQQGKNLLQAPGYLIDKYFTNGALAAKFPEMASGMKRGESAVNALKILSKNPKARTIAALLFGSSYGGAMIGNHAFHHYADRY